MTLRSALYIGSVMHRRLRPYAHRLRYRVFWMLIDLEELDCLQQSLRLFAHNRANALSFYDSDHGDGSDIPLRDQVNFHLRAAGIETNGGPIDLLCMPRVFGYGFNPLSVYFCYRPSGFIAAMLYEVHNTFGERHSYLIPVESGVEAVLDQRCHKAFYVSPFMDMDIGYAFRVEVPGERVSLAINATDRVGRVLTAALTGKRAALTDATLLRVLMTHPALTLKVTAGIHWHGLRMLFKGAKLRPRPSAPNNPVTVVSREGRSP